MLQILLADDHDLIRAGLRYLLEKAAGLACLRRSPKWTHRSGVGRRAPTRMCEQ